MRLVSFEYDRRRGYGVVENDRIAVLGWALTNGASHASPGRWEAGDLAGALAQEGLEALRQRARQEIVEPDLPLDAVQLLPPICRPRRILCVGVNYAAHRAEMGRAEVAHPTLFTRFDSTLVGHGQPLLQPAESRELDFEGELAVIIGRAGRRIPRAQALDHVAGYACFNDATARDWQRHSSQFTAGKNFPGTGGFGPWLVTTDEIPDPSTLRLVTRVNGKTMQEATTDLLLFDVPALIAYVSTFTPLDVGDVISTGTPAGVGAKRTPPVFLTAGDVVEVEISRVGTLKNRVEPADEASG